MARYLLRTALASALLVFMVGCGVDHDRVAPRVTVSHDSDLRFVHGTAIADGQALSTGLTVPDSTVAVSAVVDVNGDGYFQAASEPTMPCDRNALSWTCERPTDRVIVRTENQLVREVLISGAKFELARCPANGCSFVEMERQGLFRLTRECDGSLASFAVMSRDEALRVPLDAVYGPVPTSDWTITHERLDGGVQFHVSADTGPGVTAVRLWRGQKNRTDMLDAVRDTAVDVKVDRSNGGRELDVFVRDEVVANCMREPTCELWLGVAQRTTVASLPDLRFESVYEDFLPLLESVRSGR